MVKIKILNNLSFNFSFFIFIACEKGLKEEVEYLIPSSNLEAKNEKGETTLIIGNITKRNKSNTISPCIERQPNRSLYPNFELSSRSSPCVFCSEKRHTAKPEIKINEVKN